ncbi:MAG: OB-fold domain-containing protein [Proteobacteria bacterium]|nr:OB-fold domain-containing protein [Pseudomonadota bacterium]
MLVQHCEACASHHFPPRVFCPGCHGPLAWVPAGESGRIWSFVTVHPPLLPAYQALAPYRVVVVEPEGVPGIRMIGNLLTTPDADIGASRDTAIAIGDRVRLCFRQLTEDVTLPCWIRISSKEN